MVTFSLQSQTDRQTYGQTNRADGGETCLLSEWEFDAEKEWGGERYFRRKTELQDIKHPLQTVKNTHSYTHTQ